MAVSLSFGCTRALPSTITTAWGARWIFPADMLWDRQDVKGPDKAALLKWLNGAALEKAKSAATRMAKHFQIEPDGDENVVLFEDNKGIVLGNPQRSFGYLYVVAYLKEA